MTYLAQIQSIGSTKRVVLMYVYVILLKHKLREDLL